MDLYPYQTPRPLNLSEDYGAFSRKLRDPLFAIAHPDAATTPTARSKYMPWAEYVSRRIRGAGALQLLPEFYQPAAPGRGNPTKRADRIDWPVYQYTAETKWPASMRGPLELKQIEVEQALQGSSYIPYDPLREAIQGYARWQDQQANMLYGASQRGIDEAARHPFQQVNPQIHDPLNDPLITELFRVRAQVP